MSSFLKYRRTRPDDAPATPENQLHWRRAEEDGAPYRGVPVPLHEEERDRYVVKVQNVRVALFYMDKPEDRAALAQIYDRAANRLDIIIHDEPQWYVRPDGVMTLCRFLSWSQPEMRLDTDLYQDSAPTPLGLIGR